jgi:polysaccharide export outer membrane protein
MSSAQGHPKSFVKGVAATLFAGMLAVFAAAHQAAWAQSNSWEPVPVVSGDTASGDVASDTVSSAAPIAPVAQTPSQAAEAPASSPASSEITGAPITPAQITGAQIAAATPQIPVSSGAAASDGEYMLGAGDHIRITVYGETDLGGDFILDGTGMISIPLLGQVGAAGLTPKQLEETIVTGLSGRFLKNPRVNVAVTAYRPFYIIGEVTRPGEYPYVSGMDMVTAVALAGGYTYRANDDDVYIRRAGSTKEEELPASALTKIGPGDSIRVRERFF